MWCQARTSGMVRRTIDLAGRRVLEIGYGTGLSPIWLADRVQSVVGTDISDGILRKAHSRPRALHTEVLQADIAKPWHSIVPSAKLSTTK
jgi:predicted TPR repeat methyltransferase